MAVAKSPPAKAKPKGTAKPPAKRAARRAPAVKAKLAAPAKRKPAAVTAKPKPASRARPAVVKATPAAAPKPARSAAPKPARSAAPKPARTNARKPALVAAPAGPPPIPQPRKRSGTSLKMGAVVAILEATNPITALKRFIAAIGPRATLHDAQVALGAGQLILDPMTREHRGDPDAARVIDLVLARWSSYPDLGGYHAQEFLKAAFLAVGEDRVRLGHLAAHVPVNASADLRLDIAAAHAIAGERDAMIRALEGAIALGASPFGVTRNPDFAAFHDDPALHALLSRSTAPEIPVEIESHLDRVRAALDALVGTLHDIGDTAEVRPAADLQAVLAAERAARISLPNDYRALLTLADGIFSGSCQLFGLDDIRGTTPLAKKARAFAASEPDVDSCIPLGYIGRSTDWLFYDPAGTTRRLGPGFFVMFDQGSALSDDLADALATAASMSREQASVN